MKYLRTFLLLVLALGVFAGISSQIASSAAKPTSETVLMSEVEWSPLNPARGDNSPKAGALWGDRTGSGPSGFLVEFADGFSSPPHIHNVTYRGVVLRGIVHNDDPKAEEMWLPTGSFWTQPAGEAHVTAAEGSNSLAYLEIEEGPYLVLPAAEAFDNGERPIVVHVSNLVWLDASNPTWGDRPGVPATAAGPKIAFLWGDPQDDRPNGILVKLPAGFTGEIRGHESTFRAVVVRGRSNYQRLGERNTKTLEPGSYFGSRGEAVHRVACEAGEECIIYTRVAGKLDIRPV